MDILQLSHYLDNLLNTKEVKDSPNAMNGLQVQNTGEIKKIGLANPKRRIHIIVNIRKNIEVIKKLFSFVVIK